MFLYTQLLLEIPAALYSTQLQGCSYILTMFRVSSVVVAVSATILTPVGIKLLSSPTLKKQS